MPDPSARGDELSDIAALWWATLALGLLSIIAGIVVLAKPDNSLKAIAVISGIFILIDGIVALAAALGRDNENRGLSALIGVVSLVAGVILIRHPMKGIAAIALLVGIWLIAMGAVRVVLAAGAETHRMWRAIVGAVELIAGIVIVASPDIGLATLALLIGLALIANGASLTALGILLRGLGHEDQTPTPHHHAPAV